MKQFVSGKWIEKRWVRRRIPAVIYIFILTTIYIFNIFSVQKIHNDINKAKRKIKGWEVTAETMRTQLISITKESAIVDKVNNKKMGLLETVNPPEVLYFKDNIK